MLAEVDLVEADVERLDVPLSIGRLLQFLHRCTEVAQDDDLGLRAGEQARLTDLGLLGQFLRRLPTAQAACEAVQQHQDLSGDARQLELFARGYEVVCRQASQQRLLTSRHWAEHFASCVITLARVIVGPIDPKEVRFTHPAPQHLAEHRRIFGAAKLMFDAEHNEVILPGQVLGRSLPAADAGVLDVVSSLLEAPSTRARATPRDLVARVRTLVLENLATGQLTVGRVARELEQSERTLRRQLQASATTYQAIVDELRCELALRYVGQGRPATEVSEQLGFAEPGGFYRAFRRWTGQPLSVYRRTNLRHVPEERG